MCKEGILYVIQRSLFCFWAVLKKLPIMLKIMPITTAIMPQFVYDFIIFNNCISIYS